MGTLTSRDESSQLSSSHALSLFRALSLNDDDVIDDDDDDDIQVDDNKYYTDIEGIVQIETWDCGIACLLMISRWLRKEEDENNNNNNNNNNFDNAQQKEEDQILIERSDILSNGVQTKSIWTSDLMWQLHLWEKRNKINRSSALSSSSSSFDFVLASQQLMDVDEAYKNFQYYQNNFEKDQRRIAYTFQALYKEHVHMIQTTTTETKMKITNTDDDDDDDDDNNDFLSLSTVIEIVRRDDCVAIVLLDNRVLLKRLSSSSVSPSSLLYHRNVNDHSDHTVDDSGGDNNNNNDNANNNDDQPYAGHYVVLCGISYDSRHLEIANNHENCRLMAQSRVAATATAISKDKTNYECDTKKKKKKKSTNNNSQEQRTDFCFVLRNPSPPSCWKTVFPTKTNDDLSPLQYMFVTPKRFEASWRASGTDHDIIFIRKKRLVTVATSDEHLSIISDS
jgi:hypothetical protein